MLNHGIYPLLRLSAGGAYLFGDVLYQETWILETNYLIVFILLKASTDIRFGTQPPR